MVILNYLFITLEKINNKKDPIVTAQTQVYFYYQRQTIVFLELDSRGKNRRYTIVYAKELTVSKGVDNKLEFAIINQNQKPVNIDGKTLTLRIISYDGQRTLLQKSLVPILPLTGITSLQLTAADIEGIDPQKCYYTIEVPEGSGDYPIFVDSAGGMRGVINVVNGILPDFVQSQTVTIPTHPWPANTMSNANVSGNTVTYFSSSFDTNEQGVFTIQTYYSNFTGNTQLVGSTLQDFSFPYYITSNTVYSNFTGTVGTTIEGYHPYVRMQIVNSGTPGVLPSGNIGNAYYGGDVEYLLFR